jgi:hypothetical protein
LRYVLISFTLSFWAALSCHAQCNALPLSYCGRTDTGSATGAAPTLGAAGTSTTDPDFGSNVIRVTQSGSCSVATGNSFTPNDGAGWKRAWNADSTKLLVETDNGSWYYFIFDPVALSLGSCVNVVPNKLGNYPNFAWNTTNRIFGITPTSTHELGYWDTASGSATDVFDMSTIPGFTITSPYLLECDVNDAWCCMSSNTQDTGTQIGCYNAVTAHTQVLNLATATEKQDSAAPVALDNLSSSQLANCGIHTFIHDEGGTFLGASFNGCTAYPTGQTHGFLFWQLGTNHVTYDAGILWDSDHWALGVNDVFINGLDTSNPPPCSPYESRAWTMWPINNIGTGNYPINAGTAHFSMLNLCLTVDHDSGQATQIGNHISWLNNKSGGSADQYPVIVGAFGLTNMNGAYLEDEIFAINPRPALTNVNASTFQTATGGVIWRLGHTFNDVFSAQCALNYVSPNVSRDGKFVAFASDWKGQTGIGTCTNNRREDTFILVTAGATAGGSLGGGGVPPRGWLP